MAVNNTDKQELIKLIKGQIEKIVPDYLQSKAFTDRKLTDTPTDDLQVVPRKYVNMYGSVASRPVNSVVGQQYFDTSIGRPVFRRSDGAWVDGAGSIS